MTRNADEEGIALSHGFFLFLILGFALVFAGIVLVLAAAAVLSGSCSASFGGAIFIGPFPIVIGAGPEASLMVLFGAILAVLSVIVFLVMRRRIKTGG